MSKKRQPGTFDRLASTGDAIVTLTRNYVPNHVIPLHFHDRDQLVYATRGVMTVETEEGSWVVPTHRGVWIPKGVAHTVAMSGPVAMRTLYLKPRMAKALPRSCCVVNISPLLKELILEACAAGTLKNRVLAQRHLIDVIIDQLMVVQTVPLQLPSVSDPRAMRVAEVLMANPGSRQSLAQICQKCGASCRTIERIFQEETAMTIGKWRQQLRLMHAMRLLGEGVKITYAAQEAGYNAPSAFIAAFRKMLGTTPTLYFGRPAGEHASAGHHSGVSQRARR
ncbi:AraC family transcriptional regulator [Dyella monticola]|uniref:AraC family transcriptional regulator n=1 Tax=Dyella monticola TaxID=1927958 RepID=A0A370X339_9GAMM|nr:helix-turn-helix transcriptional regulator [Dyella monticola]RDS82834.1 AraC family transcriptional regulator [Dyella monticola]